MNKRLDTLIRRYIDGSSRDASAKAFRFFAQFVSVPYSLVIRLRNLLYDQETLRSTRVSCVTIAIGNVTLGGVGKTPFVAWLTEYCLSLGLTPGLVSRGYKSKEQEEHFKDFVKNVSGSNVPLANLLAEHLNDEACEQAIRFPTVPHFLGSKRVETARRLLLQNPNVNVLILDDAFQHRRIERDLNIVVLDALNPFGGGKVVPAGFLREPLSGLKRADVVALNRSDLISAKERESIRQQVEKFVPNLCWIEIFQRPRDVSCYMKREDALIEPSKSLELKRFDYPTWRELNKTSRFVAFCGLGAPTGFQKTLQNEKINVLDFLSFPDHCAYSSKDFDEIVRKIHDCQADALITTMKDFVKLSRLANELSVPIYALGIGVDFISGRQDFERLVQKVCIPPKENTTHDE